VNNNTEGTFFHLSAWKTVLEEALGHKGHYLFAELDGAIVGVLPLVYMSSVLFGKSLSSKPFGSVGGVLCKDDPIRDRLIDAACELATSLGVGALEIRARKSLGKGWPAKELYVNFFKEISRDNAENLKAIPRNQMAMVRKALKQEQLLSEETNDLDRFFYVYSTSVKNLGTPVFSKKLFRSCLDTFGQNCRMLMIVHNGQDVAAVMSFYYKDQVIPYFGGSVTEARKVSGNDFMYWELMRQSADEGFRVFDYGRSKVGTGSFSFKKNWGFVPEPLHYEYYLVKAEAMPEVNPTNAKYAKMINIWKMLPLPIANMLGPLLSRTLG